MKVTLTIKDFDGSLSTHVLDTCLAAEILKDLPTTAFYCETVTFS